MFAGGRLNCFDGALFMGPDYNTPGFRTAGGSRQEAGGRKRKQEAGGRRRNAEGRRQKAEGRRQKAEGRRLPSGESQGDKNFFAKMTQGEFSQRELAEIGLES
jgi:hypothetical protein